MVVIGAGLALNWSGLVAAGMAPIAENDMGKGRQ